MKTLLAMLISLNMFGNISPDYISTIYYDPSITISFENWKLEDLSVKITSVDGEIIFTDELNTIETDGIRYNLRNLESGKYKVILENDIKRVVETIILFDGKIVEKDAEVIYKPVIKMLNDKIRVSFLSYDDEAKVVFYENGNAIYTGKFDVELPFHRIFDISNLEKGRYMINVSDSKTYSSFEFNK